MKSSETVNSKMDTRKELAKELGVSHGTIGRAEIYKS